jgi:hypothetical protein
MMQKARLGMGAAAIGVITGLVPAMSASATVRTLRPLETSAVCATYKAELKASDSTESTSYMKAIESGNWPTVQKALLSTYKGEGAAEKEMVSALQGASGSVKAAAAVILGFDGTLKGIIQKSTSMTQFTSSVTSAEASPKVKSALNTLDAYTKKQCPSLFATTQTTPTT